MFKTITDFIESLGSRDESEKLAENEVRLATAALFFHAIAIDGTISEGEMAQIKSFLVSHFHLEESELNRLLTEAQRKEQDAIDIYRFTSVLRDRLSLDEKRQIIAMMWRLVYADGDLSPLEDNLIWRTAELLAVPARDRMELKRMVREDIE